MRSRTRATGLSALALATTLVLGACSPDTGSSDTSSGDSDDATASAAAPEAAEGTGAPDQAAATLDVAALPDPVAEVNGEEISRDTFVTAFESQREFAQQQADMTGTPVDETVLRDEVLDRLVDAELLHQEGERLELQASEEEVDAELETLATESGAGSTDELLGLLEEQGVDEEQAREELGRIVLIDKLIEERGGVDAPEEQELKDYYEEVTGQSADDAAATTGPEGGAAAPPYDAVRDQIEEQMTLEQENAAFSSLLEELRADAEITTHL